MFEGEAISEKDRSDNKTKCNNGRTNVDYISSEEKDKLRFGEK
jgi:hypothetical protein